MCGIAGIMGLPGAAGLVRDALATLEYRGYDSCGVAWVQDTQLAIQRAVGPVAGLNVAAGAETVALGHTRWATHGGVTEANAHPHMDCSGRVAVVHNGVLLNHEKLRRELATAGHTLRSDTDSEVLAHLWEASAGQDTWNRLAALHTALQGTYSVALLDASDPAEPALYVAKQRNPLWLAKTPNAVLLASDPVALRTHVSKAVPLEDGDHGRITRAGFELRDARGNAVTRLGIDLRGLDDRVDKAGYEHFMLKEIHETPAALNRILATHLRIGQPHVELGLPKAALRFRRALMLGAGTSYHAGLLGAAFMQRMARVPAESRATPEYKDDVDVPEPRTLLVALSQSGETLDTLQALHRLKSHPHPTLALTNQPLSTIGREADHTLALQSGIEISVAATKTFLSQSLLLHLLALAKARVGRTMPDAALEHAARRLVTLPRAIERTLHRTPQAMQMARDLATHDNLFLLAKGLHLPAAMEGALKLKEIAYQHAEAYPAGELKHGPFALLTPQTAVVFLLAPGPHEDAIRNSMKDVAARAAPVYVLAMDDADVPAKFTHCFRIPWVEHELQPLVYASALHLLSYWVAKARGLPIDRPRNLAKSVTVE
jgi:glutamine---fructose-6-phosphate transaminase (isomerizing)